MTISLNKWTLEKENKFQSLKDEREDSLMQAVIQLQELTSIQPDVAEFILIHKANEVIKILEPFKR